MADVYELSQKRIDEMQEELNRLRSTGKQEMAEKIKEAKSFGDLSENSEYDEAKSEEAQLQARITELEYYLAHAVVLDVSSISTEVVRTGLAVKVYDRTFDETAEYLIVDAPDAKPLENKISVESPVGRELLNHAVGDVVRVEIPTGFDEIEILSIYKPED